ncbi:MAG: AAA family ATPase [Pseudomonadota bacterium]
MSDMLKPLPWQEDLWLRVTSLVLQSRLTHALLIAGPRGVGKRHFAKALTAFIICEARSGYACGQCRSCLQFTAGHHPNSVYLQRDVDDKTGKEKRDISIEQIRELGERLSLSSHYGQAKVAVVDPVDALNLNGSNALLKTIEEPPANSYLILISERPQALPATLRSRCQRFRMAAPAREQALAWLGDSADAVDALTQAHGAPLRARELMDSEHLQRGRKWAAELLAVADQRRDPLAVAASIGKDDAAAFLEWLLTWLSLQLKDQVKRGGNATGIDTLIQETLLASRRLGSNANPQLVVESLLILWWRVGRVGKAA